jgi:hypothetical protein
MSFAAQTHPKNRQPAAPEYANIKVSVGGAKMCPQPAELVLAPLQLKPKRRRVEWIIEGLLPEFSIRAYCRLCLGSGSTTRAVRAPGTRRRASDFSHDDVGGGDDPDGPPPLAAVPEIQTPNAVAAAMGEVRP